MSEPGGKRHPALGRPPFRRPVGVGDEQDQTLGVGSAPGLERNRCREIADDPEIGPDAGDDLVDRQGAVGGSEFRRAPPVVTLQRVVTQVDQLVGRPRARSPSATVPARP